MKTCELRTCLNAGVDFVVGILRGRLLLPVGPVEGKDRSLKITVCGQPMNRWHRTLMSGTTTTTWQPKLLS